MQETKQITLPASGKIAVVRGYMTGLIDQEIRRISLSGNTTHFEKTVEPDATEAEVDASSMTMVMDSDPTVQIAVDNKTLELMVISIDGTQDKVLDVLLELPADDVKFLLKELNGIENASKVSSEQEKKV